MHRQCCWCIIFFDWSKAFDTVPHSTLLHKSSNSFAVVGTLHAWLKSFLKSRTQSVKTNNIPKFILYSVSYLLSLVQWSMLGLLLYAAYVNDTVRCFSYGHPMLMILKLFFLLIHLTFLNLSRSLWMILTPYLLGQYSLAYGLTLLNVLFCIFGAKNPNFD